LCLATFSGRPLTVTLLYGVRTFLPSVRQRVPCEPAAVWPASGAIVAEYATRQAPFGAWSATERHASSANRRFERKLTARNSSPGRRHSVPPGAASYQQHPPRQETMIMHFRIRSLRLAAAVLAFAGASLAVRAVAAPSRLDRVRDSKE